jgi:hypothetical protein
MWIAITAVVFAISLCFSIGATLALQSAHYASVDQVTRGSLRYNPGATI